MTDELVGVSEYVSRWARWRLTIACVDSLRERARDKKGNVKGGVIGAFAIRVGVSRRTVQRWLAYDIQSCNVTPTSSIRLLNSKVCDGDDVLTDGSRCTVMDVSSSN